MAGKGHIPATAYLNQTQVFVMRINGTVVGWTDSPTVMSHALERVKETGCSVDGKAEYGLTTYLVTMPGEKSAPSDGANIEQGNGFGPESQ